jgi:hypothetical protein
LGTLWKCGEQYRRRYVEGERLPPGIALIRGKSIHHANEMDLRHKMETGELLSLEEVMDAATDKWKAELTGPYVIGGQYDELTVEEARTLAHSEAIELAGLHHDEVAPHIIPTLIEERIEIPPSRALPVTFVSILDLIHDKTEIWDTKTAGKSPGKGDADVSDQLTGQQIAATALHVSDPETYELPKKLGLRVLVRTPKKGNLSVKEVPTALRDSDQVDAFVARANQALKIIEAETWIPAPSDSWQCSLKWCGYAQTCPYFTGKKRPEN